MQVGEGALTVVALVVYGTPAIVFEYLAASGRMRRAHAEIGLFVVYWLLCAAVLVVLFWPNPRALAAGFGMSVVGGLLIAGGYWLATRLASGGKSMSEVWRMRDERTAERLAQRRTERS